MLFKTYVLRWMIFVLPRDVLVYLKIDKVIRVELWRMCKYVAELSFLRLSLCYCALLIGLSFLFASSPTNIVFDRFERNLSYSL
jgi:hypothetical protein